MDLGVALAVASGFVLAGLGAFLLAADFRRDWNRVFALFAIFWGLQILAANAVRIVPDEGVAHAAATLSTALLIPLYFFIVVFAAIYPRPRGPVASSWHALVLLLLPAALALGILLTAPRLLLADVVPEGNAFTMDWGPLFAPLILAPFYAGLLYTLFVMMQRHAEAERAIERRQVGLVLAAIGLFVAYNAPLQLLLSGNVLVAGGRPDADRRDAALIGAVMLAGVALLGVLAIRLVRAWRASLSRTAAAEMRAVIVALGCAAAIGLAEAVVAVAGGPRVQMVGVVRAAAVALIAYGVARYQLFDLDLRVKNAAGILSTLVIVAVAGAVAWALLRSTGVEATTRTGIVAVVALVLVVPVALLARLALHRMAPHVGRQGDHLYLRKLEVYQAALGEDGDLERLRERLGLSEDDHRIAVRLREQRLLGATGLSPGMLAFDRYLIDAQLGAGAHGRVFLARDTRLGRRVAIKELDARWRGEPAVFARFLQEARAMGRLRHPNIVTLHEVERQGHDRFLILEHVDGQSLAERVSGGRIAPAEAASIACDILDGLDQAHRKGVVHRDLKPANILLDLDGRAKIADFGVASISRAADATLAGLPAPGDSPVGNLLYMAPEQARGKPAAPAADLYAVGAVLFHLLVGRPHRDLSGLSVGAAERRVGADALPALDLVPGAFRSLLSALLAPDPRLRPASARAALRLARPLVHAAGTEGARDAAAQARAAPGSP